MSKYILFMMFFVSPPALPGKQVWSLHSTQQFTFDNKPACQAFGVRVQDRLSKTATVTMRGWCVNTTTGEGTFDVKNPFKSTDSESDDVYEIPSKRNGR